MELIKVQERQKKELKIALRDAELAGKGEMMAQAASAIAALNVGQLENVEKKRAELDAQLDEARAKYKYWKTLFEDKNRQQQILNSVIRKGNELKAEIEKLPKFPTLRELQATEVGEQDLRGDIDLLLIWVDAQFNLKQPLSDAQLDTIPALIMEHCATLRLEEIGLCFKNAILGKYGKNYNRLDTEVIIGWLNQYMKDKNEMAAERRERMYESLKSQRMLVDDPRIQLLSNKG